MGRLLLFFPTTMGTLLLTYCSIIPPSTWVVQLCYFVHQRDPQVL